MNLKASRLNRWALTEGAAWYFTVMSFGHLREINSEWSYFSFKIKKCAFLVFCLTARYNGLGPGLGKPSLSLKSLNA